VGPACQLPVPAGCGLQAIIVPNQIIAKSNQKNRFLRRAGEAAVVVVARGGFGFSRSI
jgi:hypothetical protein